MAYQILKTNGDQLIQGGLIDGQVNQTATDLTLIGQNATGYGLFINDNFVHLLENFANTNQPSNPIQGQLWYDTQNAVLKVYNNNTFSPVGGTTVSSTPPSSYSAGDLWIDSVNGQLHFNAGTGDILAGPVYSQSQGVCGFEVPEDILDVYNISHTIANVYVAGALIGFFSKDAFTPQSPIAGFTGDVVVGFNASTLTGLQFNVLSSQASALYDGNTLYPPSALVKTTGSSIIAPDTTGLGALSITSAIQLILGPGNDIEISVQPEYTLAQAFQIKSNTANQNFDINLNNSSNGSTSAFFINAQLEYAGFYNNNPQATLDVGGTFRIASGKAPATSSSAGVAGQIAWDENYVYVCTSTNTWKRSALTTW
jgi:hypothetical protein